MTIFTPPALIVHGTYNGKVWGERDGKSFAFDGPTLASMRRQSAGFGNARVRVGSTILEFDESDVTLIVAALTEPEADSCHWCEEPGFYTVEYQPACEGHLRAYGVREDEAAS